MKLMIENTNFDPGYLITIVLHVFRGSLSSEAEVQVIKFFVIEDKNVFYMSRCHERLTHRSMNGLINLFTNTC